MAEGKDVQLGSWQRGEHYFQNIIEVKILKYFLWNTCMIKNNLDTNEDMHLGAMPLPCFYQLTWNFR